MRRRDFLKALAAAPFASMTKGAPGPAEPEPYFTEEEFRAMAEAVYNPCRLLFEYGNECWNHSWVPRFGEVNLEAEGYPLTNPASGVFITRGQGDSR